jgi:hypothetical protein
MIAPFSDRKLRMADIFVSYTSSDREWAFWIGKELLRLGHAPHIHEWEIPAGGNIVEWMGERLKKTDHVLCVISSVYLTKDYSSWELQAAQWAAVGKRSNFTLPVFVEDCEARPLLAPFKRCDLFGLSEKEARNKLAEYLAPTVQPVGPATFPGEAKRSAKMPPTESIPFPGTDTSKPGRIPAEPRNWSVTAYIGLVAAFVAALTGLLSQIPPAVDAVRGACVALMICRKAIDCTDRANLTFKEVLECDTRS